MDTSHIWYRHVITNVYCVSSFWQKFIYDARGLILLSMKRYLNSCTTHTQKCLANWEIKILQSTLDIYHKFRNIKKWFYYEKVNSRVKICRDKYVFLFSSNCSFNFLNISNTFNSQFSLILQQNLHKEIWTICETDILYKTRLYSHDISM